MVCTSGASEDPPMAYGTFVPPFGRQIRNLLVIHYSLITGAAYTPPGCAFQFDMVITGREASRLRYDPLGKGRPSMRTRRNSLHAHPLSSVRAATNGRGWLRPRPLGPEEKGGATATRGAAP